MLGLVPLDPHRTKSDLQVGKAPPDHLEDVSNRSTGRRGDKPDSPRKRGQRPLLLRIEEPLFGELPLQSLKGKLEGALPLGLHRLDDELVISARWVYGQVCTADHLQSVFRDEGQRRVPGTKHHGSNLCGFILQGEIEMSRRRSPKVRDFSLHPQRAEMLLEMVLDGVGELRYRIDLLRQHQVGSVPGPGKTTVPGAHLPSLRLEPPAASAQRCPSS